MAWGATLLLVGYPAGVSAVTAEPAATVAAVDADGATRWSPETVTVAAGQSVRWTYDAAVLLPHELAVGEYRGEIHPPGDTDYDEVSFPAAGVYEYFCPSMPGCPGC